MWVCVYLCTYWYRYMYIIWCMPVYQWLFVTVMPKLWSFRWDLEPSQSTLSDPQRSRADSQEPRGKGHPNHRETELRSFRHDHTPSHQHNCQATTHQEGPRCCSLALGERDKPDGQAHAGSYHSRPLVRCVGERFRFSAGWRVRPCDEESKRGAGCWPRCRGAEIWG